MAAPRISVITVVYNGAKVLPRTLASVAEQDSMDFEYIVVDGGSKDDTLQQIRTAEALIDRWVSEPDLGIYDAMNKAARLARGDYLYFLNAGDSFKHPHVLHDAVQQLEASPVMLIGRVSVTGGRANLYPVDFALDRLADIRTLFASHFCHQALFVRRQDWLATGGFDLRYPHFADFYNAVQLMHTGLVIDAPALVVANFPLDGASSDWRKAVSLYLEKEEMLSDLGKPASYLMFTFGYLRTWLYVMKKIILA